MTFSKNGILPVEFWRMKTWLKDFPIVLERKEFYQTEDSLEQMILQIAKLGAKEDYNFTE